VCCGRLLEDDADQVQGADDGDLWELRCVFVSYVLSFMYLAIYRNSHHHMFYVTERVTGGAVLLMAAIADNPPPGRNHPQPVRDVGASQSIGREPLSRALVIRWRGHRKVGPPRGGGSEYGSGWSWVRT
jgi:hypothetical protein